LKTLLCSIGLLSADHLDEAEAAGLLRVRVKHDLTFLDLAVFLEETGDLSLGQTGVDASDEEVGTRVDCAVICWSTTVAAGRTCRAVDCYKLFNLISRVY
jgi:hypothetical protein